MRIYFRCARLLMAEHLADHEEGCPISDREARIAMPEIMDFDVWEIGLSPNFFPGLLKATSGAISMSCG